MAKSRRVVKALPLHLAKKLGPETLDQIALIDCIEVELPWLRPYVIHIPNERKTSKLAGYILQRMGLLKGASDLFIAWPTESFHGLWLEMKAIKGRPTTAQIDFLHRMDLKGYHVKIAYGLDDAIQAIKDYLKT